MTGVAATIHELTMDRYVEQVAIIIGFFESSQPAAFCTLEKMQICKKRGGERILSKFLSVKFLPQIYAELSLRVKVDSTYAEPSRTEN